MLEISKPSLAASESATPPTPEWCAEITVFQKQGGVISKRIWIDAAGKVCKDGGACAMAHGTARRVAISSINAYAELLNAPLPSNEALTHGQLKKGLPAQVSVVTADELNGRTDPNTIARTKDFLVFEPGQAGLAPIDFDPKGMSPAVKQRLDECGGVFPALCDVLPALETAAMCRRPSTSSGLRHSKTGESFAHSGGEHLVIAVLDAADIPRFLSALHDRIWLAGFGWGVASTAGAFLERSPVDRACGSPERFFFEGAPVVVSPLVQEPRIAVAYEGTVLDTQRCKSLSPEERAELEKLVDAEKRRLEPVCKAAKAAWSAKHIERLVAGGKTEAAARAEVNRWIEKRELTDAFELHFTKRDLGVVTVAAVLADPERFINQTMADPHEGADYGRSTAILYRRADGSLFVKSFAHGGVIYELKDGLDIEIERLAKLSLLQYEKQREAVARKFNVRVTKLDGFVAKARGDDGDESESALYAHWAAQPWPDPVDGGVLLRALKETVRRYVFMSENQAVAVALWIFFTWLHEFMTHSPQLYVTSAEANSGKSTLLGVLNFLVRYGMLCVSISAAALYRLITKWRPTLMGDETDNLFDNPDVVAVFNSGWTRGQGVPRCNPDTGEVEIFDTFAPKALAMKGRKLPDTTLSRSIIVTMKRRRASDPKEHVEDFDHLDNETFARLRSQLLRWTIDNAGVVAKAMPEILPGFDNRRRANWKPLLAIAEACGSEWKTAAWKAAKAIEAVADTFDPSIGVELLQAIKTIFDERAKAPSNKDKIRSEDLIQKLVEDKTARWATYNKGKEISERQVAGLLKGFWPDAKDRRPRTLRFGQGDNDTDKGYELRWFTEAFARYCAPPPREEDSATAGGQPASTEDDPAPSEGTDGTDQEGGYTPSPPRGADLSVTSVTSANFNDLEPFPMRHTPTVVTDEKSANSLKNRGVTDVTDERGDKGQRGYIGPSVTDEDGADLAHLVPQPGLSPRAVDHLAREFSALKARSATELQGAIQARLAASGVPAETIDVEVERVVRGIDALGDVAGKCPAHGIGAPEPSYKVWGSAPPGERCLICGKAGDVKRIKHGGEVDMWHEDCAREHFEKLANPPVKLPELPLHDAPPASEPDCLPQPPLYRDVGAAGIANCIKCGVGGTNLRRYESAGKQEVWHRGCLDQHLRGRTSALGRTREMTHDHDRRSE